MYGYRKEGDDASKEFGATREYSDEFKKFSSKYSEINATWNSLNETNKYKKDIESLLSYEKNGKVNYLCKTGKRGAVIKNIHGREMKILKSVLKEFPNKEFWHKVKFDKKFKSLATVLGDVGKIFIKRKYSEFHYKPKIIKMPKIYDEKFGEDLEIEKEKRSVKDYFNE